MLIYLGLFFIIPDKFRSAKYLPITLSVGILVASLGLYGIWKAKQVPENFGAGIGEACGASNIMCGADDSSGAPSQLYVITSPTVSSQAAGLKLCKEYGGELASLAQVSDAYNNGASTQMWGWVSDGPTHQGFAVRNNSLNDYYASGSIMEANTATNCWGPRPPRGTFGISPWTDRANTVNGITYAQNDWSRKNSSGTPLAVASTFPKLNYCLINERTLPKDSLDQSVVFNIFGRYVRVMTGNAAWFHLSQVAIYDTNGTNIAVGKAVTSTPGCCSTAAANVVVDGVLTPRNLDTNRVWHSNGGGREIDYLQVDLGSVQMITSVRIISRADCCTDRIPGVRIRVLKTTDEIATNGTCIMEPSPVYPTGTTTDEQVKLRSIILGAMDGQKARNVLRGIMSSTSTSLTNYGLTDSQAAAAYNKLYIENLNFRRAGWQVSATWTTGSQTLTITGGVTPLVNMRVKKATGIPVNARVSAVSGTTVTLDTATDVATIGDGHYTILGGTLDESVQTGGYKGRYVRLRPSLISGDGVINFSQVVVYDMNGSNVALGKTITTYPTHSWSPPASVTVDGTISPRGWGGVTGGVWHSDGGKNLAFWQVDLGSEKEIQSVRILGRSDCCLDRMMGIRIQISNLANPPNATKTITNQPVTFNGDLDDTTYFSLSNSIRNMLTVASITYDKSATLADYMRWNKANISVASLDSAGNPVLNSAGNPVMNSVTDNGETAATSMIMSVTKVKGIDPSAIESSATKATTTSPQGVAGYNVPAPPSTSNWSATSLNKIAQQTTAINLGEQAPIIVNPDTTDAQIAAQATGAFRTPASTISREIMDGGASSTTSSAGYTAPTQTQNAVAGANGAEKEVFVIGNLNGESGPWFGSREAARQACVAIGADGLATLQQLRDAHANGAQWCLWGWLTDAQAFPRQEAGGCTGQGAIVTTHSGNGDGAVCWGYKPSKNSANAYRTRPFSDRANNVAWNQKTKINTLTCPSGKTRISCNGADVCLNPGTACARSCPSGTSWNSEKQMCKP